MADKKISHGICGPSILLCERIHTDGVGLEVMDTDTTQIYPNLYMPHPNFSDEVNRNIVQSEIEGGVHLDHLTEGTTLRIETQHRWYTIVLLGQGNALISGHPQFCPSPVMVRIMGSTWGGSMLKSRFIGRGMHLEFRHPTLQTITTSRIVDIQANRPEAATQA